MTSPASEVPFLSKAQHVAEAIRRALMQEAWKGQLPGENRLKDEFRVSRATVRRALELLTVEGVLLPAEAGLGRKVRPDWRESTARTDIPVGVLIEKPLQVLMPSTLSHFRTLRHVLEGKGCEVRFITSPAWGKRDPSKLLRKVMDQHPMKVWVVYNPTPAMEQWLETEQIPCVCIGGSDQHTLPSVGSRGKDFIRRAARELIELGHREIFFPICEEFGGGMVESFLEEMGTLGAARRDPRYTPHWGGHAVECFAMLEGLFRKKPTPTAFVTLGLVNLLPILTWLGGRRLAVPQDVSIIHMLYDPTLDRLYPPITHYKVDALKVTRQAAKLVLKLAETGKPFDRKILEPMERVDGRSIAPPPRH